MFYLFIYFKYHQFLLPHSEPHGLDLKVLQEMYLFTSFGEEMEFKDYGVEGTGKNYTPCSL